MYSSPYIWQECAAVVGVEISRIPSVNYRRQPEATAERARQPDPSERKRVTFEGNAVWKFRNRPLLNPVGFGGDDETE